MFHNAPQQAQQQMPQLPPELVQLLRSLLTQMPDQPAGNVSANTPATSIPQMAKGQDPQQQMMSMLIGLLQQGNPVANAQSGLQGFRGAAGGIMGGRPRGS
jgi:hypothetical protein